MFLGLSELDGDTLPFEVPLQVAHELELLLDGEPADDELQNRANGDVCFADEAAVVDVGEDAHEESVIACGLVCMNDSTAEGDTYWQSMRSVMPPCPGML